MRNRLGVAVVLAGLFGTSAIAEEEIQWKQVLNVPTGANLPAGLLWDVLGIRPGDSYEVVRPRLSALLAESIPQAPPTDKTTAALLGQDTSEPLEEVKLSMYLPVAGGQNVKATYVDRVELRRELKGSGPRPIEDHLTLRFSMPSSGSQVLSIDRRIRYYEHTDQVRIGDMIKSITAKYGATPVIDKAGQSTTLKFIFDNGKPFVPKNVLEDCASGMDMDINDIEGINKKGSCDVVLEVILQHGLSDDHAANIRFHLYDYARGKENKTADRAYFDAYLNDVRSRTAGQAPKL
jgi:hypothetical protein